MNQKRDRLAGILFVALCLATSATYAHEMPSGLIVHMPFDGSLENRGSYPATAQWIGEGGASATSQPEFREGRFGQSLYFGGDAAVRLPIDTGKDIYPRITVTAWVFLEEGSTNGYVLSRNSRAGPTLRASTSEVSASGYHAGLSGTVAQGSWVFMAAVYDTTQGSLRFHFGDPRRQQTDSPSEDSDSPVMYTWIGSWNDTLQGVLANIRVDDLRIYDSALSQDELVAVWSGEAAAQTGTTSGSTAASGPLLGTPDLSAADGGPQVSGSVSAPAAELAEDVEQAQQATPQTWSAATPEYQAEVEGEFMELDPDSGTGAAESGNQPAEERKIVGWQFSSDDVSTSAVSGEVGSTIENLDLRDPHTGIYQIGITERNNVPCIVRISGENISDHTDKCGSVFAGSQRLSAYIDGVATGIAVCSNRLANKRVKGIQLRGRVINADGTLGADEFVDSRELTNCAEWRTPSLCPQGYAGTGVRAHFNDQGLSHSSDELVGLQLKCRRILEVYQ